MRLNFYVASKENEALIANAFVNGARRFGVRARVLDAKEYDAPIPGTDVAMVIGVKGRSKDIMRDHQLAGIQVIYVDKGYTRLNVPSHLAGPSVPRSTLYWKVSVGGFQPLAHVMKDWPVDRWKILQKHHGLRRRPWRKGGDRVVILGASQKSANFHDLGDTNDYAERLARSIRKHCRFDVVYRPKQSFAGFREIEGARLSRPPIRTHDELKSAWALVTHNSNTSVEAVLAGVPVVALGPALARPISSTTIEEVADPRLASDDEVDQFLCGMAYMQWTIAEMNGGGCWDAVRLMLEP